MKVKDLIEELGKLDPDLLIVVNGHEGGCDDRVSVGRRQVALNVRKRGDEGPHEVVKNDCDFRYYGREEYYSQIWAVHIR